LVLIVDNNEDDLAKEIRQRMDRNRILQGIANKIFEWIRDDSGPKSFGFYIGSDRLYCWRKVYMCHVKELGPIGVEFRDKPDDDIGHSYKTISKEINLEELEVD